MFTLNLMAAASEVDWLHPSTLGWIVIAFVWSIIGALRLAGGFLTAKRASQSSTLTLNKETLEARSST
jgi:hypothetical protein